MARRSGGGHGCLSLIGLAVVILFGVGVVATVLVALAGDDDPAVRSLADGDDCSTIVYEVTGTATRAAITASRPSGLEQYTDVALPWSLDSGCHGDFDIPVLGAQNAGDGDITCTIKRDGVVTAQATSTGAFATVQCSESP